MFFKRKFKYIFLIIPLTIIYRPFLFFGNQYMNNNVSSIFLSNMFGGSYATDKIKITLSVLSLFSIIIINILLSEYICENLLQSGEYIFSRVKNKSMWYIHKNLKLLVYSFIGVALTIITYFAGSLSKSSKPLTFTDISIILQATIILTLFAYLTSNLINLFSLKYGVSIGFIIVYSTIVISEIATYLLQSASGNLITILQRINPMSNVTIGWNFSSQYVWFSIVYFIILNLLTILIGLKIINNYEIGIKNIEQ